MTSICHHQKGKVSNTDSPKYYITNNFCPLKPKLNFALDKANNHTNAKINAVIYSSFFLTNLLYILIPFICYGSSFFTTTLPVMDELIRYYRFKNSFRNFPQSFPRTLPALILNGHIIFPVTSILCFLAGCLLFVLYQMKFHFWATVRPTDVAEFCQEKEAGLEEAKHGEFNDGASFKMTAEKDEGNMEI